MRLPVFCVQLVGDLYPLKTNTQPLQPPNASETYSSEGGFDSREETGQQPRKRGPGGPGQRSWMMVRGVAQICCSPAKLVHGPMCRLC